MAELPSRGYSSPNPQIPRGNQQLQPPIPGYRPQYYQPGTPIPPGIPQYQQPRAPQSNTALYASRTSSTPIQYGAQPSTVYGLPQQPQIRPDIPNMQQKEPISSNIPNPIPFQQSRGTLGWPAYQQAPQSAAAPQQPKPVNPMYNTVPQRPPPYYTSIDASRIQPFPPSPRVSRPAGYPNMDFYVATEELERLKEEIVKDEKNIGDIEGALKTIARMQFQEKELVQAYESVLTKEILNRTSKIALESSEKASKYLDRISNRNSKAAIIDAFNAPGMPNQVREEMSKRLKNIRNRRKQISRDSKQLFSELQSLWIEERYFLGDEESLEYVVDPSSGGLFTHEDYAYWAPTNLHSTSDDLPFMIFKNMNGVEKDPKSTFQRHIAKYSSWSKKDKGLFIERFQLFGKDFHMIAKGIPGKTTNEVIEFYYLNKNEIKTGALRTNVKRGMRKGSRKLVMEGEGKTVSRSTRRRRESEDKESSPSTPKRAMR